MKKFFEIKLKFFILFSGAYGAITESMQALNDVGDSPNSRTYEDHSDCQSLESIPHYYSSDNSPTTEFYPPIPEQKYQPPVLPEICHGKYSHLIFKKKKKELVFNIFVDCILNL